MLERAIDLRVNLSEETIHLGPLVVRFLITGDNSNGSIAGPLNSLSRAPRA